MEKIYMASDYGTLDYSCEDSFYGIEVCLADVEATLPGGSGTTIACVFCPKIGENCEFELVQIVAPTGFNLASNTAYDGEPIISTEGMQLGSTTTTYSTWEEYFAEHDTIVVNAQFTYAFSHGTDANEMTKYEVNATLTKDDVGTGCCDEYHISSDQDTDDTDRHYGDIDQDSKSDMDDLWDRD